MVTPAEDDDFAPRKLSSRCGNMTAGVVIEGAYCEEGLKGVQN